MDTAAGLSWFLREPIGLALRVGANAAFLAIPLILAIALLPFM